MNPSDIEKISALYWIINNGFINENQKKMEFENHKFLIEPYLDESPEMVIKKSAQIGFSTLAILRVIHKAAYRGANIIYTLPNRNVGGEFLIPKWEPIVNQNPPIKKLMGGTDTPSLKKVGNRYLYFRGTFSDTEAISISADGLVNDEVDKSDQKVLSTYESRLDAADPTLKFRWEFSNPSLPDFGIDAKYKESDMMVWMVKCSNGHQLPITWPTSIDIQKKEYVCSQCHIPLLDRTNGVWVAQNRNSSRRGYWISQLMCPWIPATKVIRDYETKPPDVFWNFTIGDTYAPADMLFQRTSFTGKLMPGTPPPGDRVLGVDNGVIKHWVLGSAKGMIAYGKTESWEEIELLKRMHNAKMIVDANPYPAMPEILAKKYPGEVYLHYYVQDRNAEAIIRWKTREQVVQVDRTKMIDKIALKLAQEFPEPPYTFYMSDKTMEPYINHFLVMKRMVKMNHQRIEKGVWITPEGADDHWAHASFMCWVGIEGLASPDAVFSGQQQQVYTSPTSYDGMKGLEEMLRKPRDWRGR